MASVADKEYAVQMRGIKKYFGSFCALNGVQLDVEKGTIHALLGENGATLSGGERQRVSIARAILANPKILILDEATAAVDTETERKIQAALEKLIVGKTTISIAHRISTLKNADKLIVIEDGKITERGTHKELIQQKGTYFKLLQIQSKALAMRGVAD